MPIYKLTDIDPTSHHWGVSNYRGEVVVRAEDEKKARGIAAKAFRAVAEQNCHEDVVTSPWTNPHVCAAEAVADQRFPQDGPEAILLPRVDPCE